jgi:hypothetical protein
VTWSVNVVAATNYVLHNGNHSGSRYCSGSVLWHAATNCVPILLSSNKLDLICSDTPQDATVAACGVMLPVWEQLHTMFS